MTREIALLIETSRGYGRGLLRGIATYVNLRGGWTLRYIERSLEETPPDWLQSWSGDGILARIETEELAQAALGLGLPVVDLRNRFVLPGVPSLDTDPDATATLALEHFMQSGLRELAFFGFPGVDFSDARERSFLTQARHLGVDVHTFRPARSEPGSASTLRRESLGSIGDPRMADWLAELPKPIGIFACNDARGRQLLQECRRGDLAVPDQVAVLGVDNDHVLCELSAPSLSSIEPATGEMGFRGAEILDGLINGEAPPESPMFFPPLRVVTRRSSDTVLTANPTLAIALRFIRDNACNGIKVQDVIVSAQTSRATLERRFRETVGRTPKEHIMETRLQHVQRLLVETRLPLAVVSRNTGFQNESHLSVVFKRLRGTTPGQFRRNHSPIF